MLSLAAAPYWSAVAYRLQEGLLGYTANMPPVREASPNLQQYNLAIEKAKGWEGGGRGSRHGAHGLRACGWSAGKTALSL